MNSINVKVGTRNRNKIRVVIEVIEELSNHKVSINVIDAPTGVPDAPHDQDIYIGALNRAMYCKNSNNDDSTLFIGVESGIVQREGTTFEETWAVIIRGERKYLGYSSGLVIPETIIRKMKNDGIYHNEVMKQIDIEQGKDQNTDTWSTYTGGVLSRDLSLKEAVRNALIQILVTENSLYNLS